VKDYIQYHNTAKQGRLPECVDEFSIFARKSIRHIEAHRMWLISGEGDKSPKRYFLRYTFIVDRIEPGTPNRAYGREGRNFPNTRLDTLDWFEDFLKRYQNFSLGVRELADDDAKLFRAIAGMP
jgi:hypothetical protein